MPYLPHPLYRGIPRYGEYYIHPKQGMVTNWRDERPSPHQGTLFPPGTGTMGSQDPSNKHRHMRWKTINKMTRDDGKIPHGRGWTDAKTNTATTLYQSDIPYPRLADTEADLPEYAERYSVARTRRHIVNERQFKVTEQDNSPEQPQLDL